MDQEHTERNRSRSKARQRADEAAERVERGETDTADVPDESAEGDEVQELREETPVVAPHDPRAVIAEGLGDLLTPVQVTYLLHEVLAITKRVPIEGDCSNCGKHFKTIGEVSDAKAVVSALTSLIDHGFGRPDVAKMERDMVTFQRFTDFSDWEAAGAPDS